MSESNYLLDLLVACGPVYIALNKQVRYCLKVALSITPSTFCTSLKNKWNRNTIKTNKNFKFLKRMMGLCMKLILFYFFHQS